MKKISIAMTPRLMKEIEDLILVPFESSYLIKFDRKVGEKKKAKG